jgi:Uncharacterized protein conserved in bacteria
MQQSRFPVRGAGLGLRRDHLDALEQQVPACINFFEIAPEKLDWNGSCQCATFACFERVVLRLYATVYRYRWVV